MPRQKRPNSRTGRKSQRLDSKTFKGSKSSWQPLDRAAAIAMVLLSIVIAAMLLFSSQALPQVRTFSWDDKAVGAEDIAFLMEFTQPVDTQSVEENLKINPSLPGKFSWAGRKMAYTLAVPAPYGEEYQVSLLTAKALNGKSGFEQFQTAFRTRDRIFAYIGVEGEELGRLILYNVTSQQKTLLTDASQRVLNFQPYPDRDRILYLATPLEGAEETGSSSELYTVTTGLSPVIKPSRWQFWRSDEPIPAGKTQKLLDDETYQNLKFDLSPDGKRIVIQRISRESPSDTGPWVLTEGEAPRKLETAPSGDFRIAPDSLSLLLQQGEGTAVVALEDASEDQSEQAGELLDFLSDYGQTLDVASDGSAAAFVNFNQDDPEKQFTQSLFWVSNRGEEKQLLQTEGSIVQAQFSDNNEVLYGLIERPVPGEDYQVVPYLSAINISTGEVQELLEMPPQPDITVSLSPDGLAILFDEALVSEQNAENVIDTADRPTHRLWLLPLFRSLEARLDGDPTSLPATELEIFGRHPAWLP